MATLTPHPVATLFPDLSARDYAALLEQHGFEVRSAQLFDRPTPLEGEDGMANWLRQFKWYYFEGLRPGQQQDALQEVVEELRPSLHAPEGWFADYRRLRISAVKVWFDS